MYVAHIALEGARVYQAIELEQMIPAPQFPQLSLPTGYLVLNSAVNNDNFQYFSPSWRSDYDDPNQVCARGEKALAREVGGGVDKR